MNQNLITYKGQQNEDSSICFLKREKAGVGKGGYLIATDHLPRGNS